MSAQGRGQDFTLAGYRRLMSAFQSLGYSIRSFETVDPGAAHLVVRHDVDMSLGAALTLAQAEAEAGISATYFFLLRTEFYNLFSARGADVLQQIRGLGHDIGLHFDAALYADDHDALDAAAHRECDALEVLLSEPVATVSFHRPARSLLNSERRIAGRAHAYQPRFFSAMGYCSDSRGAWHHGHPLEHEVLQNKRALQLLTHPVWWYLDARESPAQRTARFVRERAATLDLELSNHCAVHRPGPDGGLHDLHVRGMSSC